MFLQLALDQLAGNLSLNRHVPRRRKKNPHYRRLLAARLRRDLSSPLLCHSLDHSRTRERKLTQPVWRGATAGGRFHDASEAGDALTPVSLR